MGELPEFDAYEVNELKARSKRNDYYKKCYLIVLDYLDDNMTITEKTKRWLWGIKADLRESGE